MNCPNCRTDVIEPTEASQKTVLLDHYACGECGHLWITHKGSSIVVKNVTPIRDLTAAAPVRQD